MSECADAFQAGAKSAKGINAKLTEIAAHIAGNGDMTGFYTPTFDSPFAGIEGVPDLAVGMNFLGPMDGARGPGTPVHMYVDEQGSSRSVQLVSKHGFTNGPRAARLTRKVFDVFRAADPNLTITAGNL
ncbi:MAG: hypothetical protein AAGC46_00855 [Solirubrobacteraceae bacterium]|nr:hypothetical protein [Patulibacter sp.]